MGLNTNNKLGLTKNSSVICTVLSDIVARQVLKIERAAGNQFFGTMFDSFGPLGPCLVAKGSGGYGNPHDRERELVRLDVIVGYINEATARDVYGLSDYTICLG